MCVYMCLTTTQIKTNTSSINPKHFLMSLPTNVGRAIFTFITIA